MAAHHHVKGKCRSENRLKEWWSNRCYLEIKGVADSLPSLNGNKSRWFFSFFWDVKELRETNQVKLSKRHRFDSWHNKPWQHCYKLLLLSFFPSIFCVILPAFRSCGNAKFSSTMLLKLSTSFDRDNFILVRGTSCCSLCSEHWLP